MAMVSSLIGGFSKQTKNTILEHLDKLAVNNAVYSTHLKGFEPHLKDRNILIYIHAASMVVVCFDLCGQIEEIAEEEDTYDIGAPEYYWVTCITTCERTLKFCYTASIRKHTINYR